MNLRNVALSVFVFCAGACGSATLRTSPDGSTDAAGTTGSGGAGGAGGAGAGGKGGQSGAGGLAGAGGSMAGAGGAAGGGGAGGSGGGGGSAATCQSITCGARQTCAVVGGTAKCSCNADPVCASAASVCMGASTLVSCVQDADGCFYQASSAACPTGLVCERSVPTSCVDPNWAEWPMPNVQVDVTAGAPNLSSYTDNGDGTVTDNVTKLMWQQTVSGTYTWAQAQTHCAAVTVAGHSDWRLPSQIELESVVDYGQATAPFINSTYFPSTPSIEFWSSTPLVGGTTGWPVFFVNGFAVGFSATGSYPVRCVR